MAQVQNGERLPDIVGRDAENNEVSITELAAGQWTAILLYRGHW